MTGVARRPDLVTKRSGLVPWLGSVALTWMLRRVITLWHRIYYIAGPGRVAR